MNNLVEERQKTELNVQGNESTMVNKIGPGTVIEGNLKTASDLRIDGTIKGNIHSSKKILLGESGTVEGQINSNNVGIKGKIKGELKIKETLYLHASGNIEGKIVTKNLIIEDGAIFNGECHTGQSPKISETKESKPNLSD